jgi:hypothetical protein
MTYYYLVNGEEKNLLDEDWDFLIILDCSRYDYFKKIYRKYLKEGELKKAFSPAFHTMDWLNKVFPEFYDDIVYVSANPYINSKMETTSPAGEKYKGKEHFFKIIDVWNWGWNDKLGSIPPNEINRIFLKIRNNYKNKRFILHYIQPHKPYLGKNYIQYSSKESLGILGIKKSATSKTDKDINFFSNCKSLIQKTISRLFGIGVAWKIFYLVYGDARSQEMSIYIKEGWDGLRKAYEENLELVLKEVKEIVDKVEGKVLITADHGELLGEYRLYAHPNKPRKTKVTEVPWLEIKR